VIVWVAPGAVSGTVVGLAVLTIVTVGFTSVMSTLSLAWAETGWSSSSVPNTVTTSVTTSPALPVTSA
jgi:hypothetical protein